MERPSDGETQEEAISQVPESPKNLRELLKFLINNPEITNIVYCIWPGNEQETNYWLGLITSEKDGHKGRGQVILTPAEFQKLQEFCSKKLGGRVVISEKNNL